MKARAKLISRDFYCFKNKGIILRKGTKFSNVFRKWYLFGNNIVPNKVYDYLERKGVINDK